MSFQTTILDPVFHSNLRTRFDLPSNAAISSFLRLVRFGANLPDGSSPPYINNLGVYGCIKRITLMSGGRQVDVVRDCQEVMSIKNLQTSSQEKNSLQQVLTGVTLNIDNADAKYKATNEDLTLFNGRINLAKVLPVLEATELVAYDRPQLLIEYETDMQKIFQHSNQPPNFTMNQPQLIYDLLPRRRLIEVDSL